MHGGSIHVDGSNITSYPFDFECGANFATGGTGTTNPTATFSETDLLVVQQNLQGVNETLTIANATLPNIFSFSNIGTVNYYWLQTGTVSEVYFGGWRTLFDNRFPLQFKTEPARSKSGATEVVYPFRNNKRIVAVVFNGHFQVNTNNPLQTYEVALDNTVLDGSRLYPDCLLLNSYAELSPCLMAVVDVQNVGGRTISFQVQPSASRGMVRVVYTMIWIGVSR